MISKIKKVFLLLLIVFVSCLFGCSSQKGIKINNSQYIKKLNSVSYPNNTLQNSNIDMKYVNILNNFTIKTATKIFTDSNKNYVYSPISLYMALSMLIEGADGNTYEEIEELLGIDSLAVLEDLNKNVYDNNYYDNSKGNGRLANSIWVKEGYKISENYVSKLAEKYYAEAYDANFSNIETKKNIVKWINHYTNGFLDLTTDNYKIDDDILILLLNTIYFDNKWKKEFKTSNSFNDVFYTNKEQVNASYMKHSVSSIYQEKERFTSIVDYFENDKSITYILPNDNYTVFDCLDSIIDLYIYDETIRYVEATISVPKFKYFNNHKLNNILKELGLEDMFSETKANFKNIDESNGLYVSYVKQDVGIELNEEGVKAAAVTSIGMEKSVGPSEPINFYLNRPFIYIINDRYGAPLFIGIIQNPNIK